MAAVPQPLICGFCGDAKVNAPGGLMKCPRVRGVDSAAVPPHCSFGGVDLPLVAAQTSSTNKIAANAAAALAAAGGGAGAGGAGEWTRAAIGPSATAQRDFDRQYPGSYVKQISDGKLIPRQNKRLNEAADARLALPARPFHLNDLATFASVNLEPGVRLPTTSSTHMLGQDAIMPALEAFEATMASERHVLNLNAEPPAPPAVDDDGEPIVSAVPPGPQHGLGLVSAAKIHEATGDAFSQGLVFDIGHTRAATEIVGKVVEDPLFLYIRGFSLSDPLTASFARLAPQTGVVVAGSHISIDTAAPLATQGAQSRALADLIHGAFVDADEIAEKMAKLGGMASSASRGGSTYRNMWGSAGRIDPSHGAASLAHRYSQFLHYAETRIRLKGGRIFQVLLAMFLSDGLLFLGPPGKAAYEALSAPAKTFTDAMLNHMGTFAAQSGIVTAADMTTLDARGLTSAKMAEGLSAMVTPALAIPRLPSLSVVDGASAYILSASARAQGMPLASSTPTAAMSSLSMTPTSRKRVRDEEEAAAAAAAAFPQSSATGAGAAAPRLKGAHSLRVGGWKR